MVQALVNNMNIQNGDTFSVTDNQVCTNPQKDFSNILKTKTINTDKNSDKNTAECSSNTKTAMTIGMMKEAVHTDLKNIQDVIQDVINESSIEAALDLTLVREENPNIYDITTAAVTEDDATAEDNTTTDTDVTNEDNTDETITTEEEDPTMNKAVLIQPPENPTLALVWHTQVHPAKQDEEIQNSENQENVKTEVSIKTDNAESESMFKNLLPEENNSENISLEETAEDDEIITKTEGTKLSDILTEEMADDLNIEVVKTETGGEREGSSDFMFYQSPQEQSMKGMLFGSVKYEPVQTVSPAQNIEPSKILEQISKQMESMFNGSKVEIILNPENLGKVALQIMNTKEGLMAQFTVTTQDVRNMLMKGLGSLKDNLLAHGVNVDNVSVKLNETTESEYHFDWTEGENSGNGYRGQNPHKQKQDEKQFEQMMFEIENNDNV